MSDKESALRECVAALHKLQGLIGDAQSTLARYLPPDGIDKDQAISQLLHTFDGPEQREAEAARAVAIACAEAALSAPVQSREAWAKEADRLVQRALLSECCAALTVGDDAPDLPFVPKPKFDHVGDAADQKQKNYWPISTTIQRHRRSK